MYSRSHIKKPEFIQLEYIFVSNWGMGEYFLNEMWVLNIFKTYL